MDNKLCFNCRVEMLRIDVFLLDEYYDDYFTSAHYGCYYCPECGRLIRDKKNGYGSGRVVSYMRGSEAA